MQRDVIETRANAKRCNRDLSKYGDKKYIHRRKQKEK